MTWRNNGAVGALLDEYEKPWQEYPDNWPYRLSYKSTRSLYVDSSLRKLKEV